MTTKNIPSGIQDGSDDFFALFPPTAEDPYLVWIEKGVVKSVALTPKLANKPQSVKGSTNAKIVDVGLSEYGLFVVKKEDGSASVLRLDRNTIEPIWDFADSVSCWPPRFELSLKQAYPRQNPTRTLIQCTPVELTSRGGRMLGGCTGHSVSRYAIVPLRQSFSVIKVPLRAGFYTSSHLTCLGGRDWLLGTPSHSTPTTMGLSAT